MKSEAARSLQESIDLLTKIISSTDLLDLVNESINVMSSAFQHNNKIISCGNGGSMSDAIHFAEELTGRYKQNRKALPAIAISDPGHISCVSNDYGYDQIFSRFLQAHGNKGDILLAISTSGNSSNVINAVHEAKKLQMISVGLLGKDGGALKKLVDFPIVIPSMATERIQEIHIKLIHIFIEGIERNLFDQLY